MATEEQANRTAQQADPDPQQDRHVAFPGESGPAVPPSLPPDAWARPRSGPEPRRPASPRRNRWPAVLLLVPLTIGLANADRHGRPDAMSGRQSVSADEQLDRSETTTVVTPVTGDPPIAAPLPGSPPVVPWSSDRSRLRVEVVSTTTGSTPDQANVVVRGTYLAGWSQTPFDGVPLPVAYDLTLSPGADGAEVTATARSADTIIQCRIYAGPDLVAVATDRGEAVCTLGQ